MFTGRVFFIEKNKKKVLTLFFYCGNITSVAALRDNQKRMQPLILQRFSIIQERLEYKHMNHTK